MQRKRTWLLIPSIILGITGVTSFANMLQERSNSTLNLTAQAKPSENMIRLDWTAIPNTTYKVFQRPEGSSEFNPISMTNFDNQDPVKVLNIYPSQGVPPKKVHQNDLAFSPEKQSALLNDWIKDYGLGKITVDTVNIDAFGSNPDRYLKDSSGNYKYDVLAIGFWNINYESMFLNDRGVQAVADFINYGGGVLAGHHHLGVFQLDKGLNQIKDLFGVKFVIEQGTLGLHSAPLRDTELANVDVVMPDISEAVHTSRYWYGSEKVKIEKKGLLTQYPWNIETENLLLDIPYSHNGHDFVTGDVWLSFVPGVAHNSPNGTPVKELTELPDGTTGTKGAYLSTYKNTAFIQTGHNSIVNHDTALEATEDEKKILVNTLFYLNQLSDDPYLNDHSGRDLADPVISKVDQTIDGSTFKFTVTAMDQGSTYDYYVEAQPKDGSAKLTSNIATETITTGIQGYSYVVDSNPTTEPDHTVDSTSNVITGELSSDEMYLHIKVIDNAGNVSETTHIKLEKNSVSTPIDLDLTAEAKPAENMIRLDWNGLDNHTYQVFQKKEDSDEFQSISMTDLNKSKQVQVLNIYPINGHTSTSGTIPTDTPFTTWDGETLTLPQSARLKRWMEEPNSEHPRGYGQGIIEVTPIPIDQFNSNYQTILKNTDGSWKYDVIMIGSWDGRGNTTPTISNAAVDLISEFIDSGRGVLAGHDTIGYTQGTQSGLGRIREKFNIKVGHWKGSGTPDTDHNYFSGFTSTKVNLQRKGLLSNYPWDLGSPGTIFNVPLTHTTSNFAYGDIWMNLSDPDPYDDVDPQKQHTPDHLIPYAQFYLTTWNNTAMIQTGHSEGQATPDEQKILANTLFYLNQLSSDNYLNDHSGQDVKAPEKPSIKSTQSTTDGFVELTFNPFVDQESIYEYYVKATHKNGNSNAISPVVRETITTGVAGVSYVIDTHPKTEPDAQLDTLVNNKLKVKLSETKTVYIHLKVIDHAGNTSETLHIPITEPPVLRSEVVDNEYVRLDWATELLSENILWETSFESQESIDFDFVYNASNGLGNGGQKFSISSFTGERSAYTPVTIPDKGNAVTVNMAANGQTSSRNHIWYKNKPVTLPNNAYISASFRLRAPTGSLNSVQLYSDFEHTNEIVFYETVYAKDYPAGTTTFEVQDISKVEPGFRITTDPYADTHVQNMQVKSVNTTTKTFTTTEPSKFAVKKGDRVKGRNIATMFKFSELNMKGTNQWELYNLNAQVSNPNGINWLKTPVILRQLWSTDRAAYIDDLKIGYATKVKLYRDGTPIYEGYDAFLNDLDATDQTAPNPIDSQSIEISSERLLNGSTQWVLKFKPATDEGSIYSYQISAINQYDIESILSNPVTETLTSGIQGYSYLLDKNPTSEPDNTVDLTADQRQISYTGSGTSYLHIKVIDNAGNVSETQHIKLTGLDLTAEAKPSENMIRLDWTNLTESTYQVYQKKEGATEFQSISTTDFESTEQIKVLNVYPNPVTFEVGSVDNVMETYQTWDGETVTLPKAASLKRWMEEPNAESPKGYGKGLIEVTAVGFDVFNANPQSVLNQNDLGEWNYDVVFVGSWDCNGSCTNEVGFFNTPTTDYLRTFIESGRGLLVGHDFKSFREQLVTSNVNDASKTISSNQIRITQKGVMTNYPWDLGEVGTILDIPTTHNNGNFIRGDVDLWMKFEDFQNPSRCFVWCNAEELRSNGETNNHYLITKNNIGVIQTGHSNGEATPDEQKILANTLFYLNQLSAENYLEDHSGQDVKDPVKPSVNKTELLPNGFIELQFNELIDRGSTYEYYVKATHKSGYEQVSNTVKETITTGIKGVSYVIDTHPDTEPDNQIDAFDNNTLQIKPNQSQTTYLHIKALDKAGNSSETLHYVLDIMTLTAEARPTENNGKGLVRLDWTDKLDHTYQVFQKKEGSDEFQSIGATNFNVNKTIRVLNIYPEIQWIEATSSSIPIPTETFTTWDGETLTLPQSARLKRWMEESNSEHPKGYGKGIIEVTPVSIYDFNKNPEFYLKHNNQWKIDIIMFGSWDSNGEGTDLSDLAATYVKEFIDTEKGVLFGHDTIRNGHGIKNFLSFQDYLNMKVHPIDYSQNNWHRGISVKLTKNGLFNTYPWFIGNAGTDLTIPSTHTVDQEPFGDIWLTFNNTNAPQNYNFYLTTWNNTAMIQTGHSNGEATPDEQKILANVLFYLNQQTTENYLDDYSGQDVKAPDMPSIKNHTYSTDSFIWLNFDKVQDNGSTYEYYVKATHKNGTGTATSNIASATVTSGLKGYSWIADSNPDTIPDDIIEQATNNPIKIPTNNKGSYYFHIKAIDRAGNVSETFHYELTDTDKPTLSLSQNPTSWTNQDVIITATATDLGKVTSGIKEIILPDGNKVAGSTATFTAVQNGTYTFEAVDFMGNRQTASITITNIDKIKPTGSIIIDQDQDEFYDEETEIHLSMSDILDGQEKLSGIAKVEIFDVNGTYSHTLTNPTDYQQTLPWVLVPYEMPDGSLKAQVGMTLTDKAGNTTTIYSKEVTIIKVRIDEFHLTDVVNPRIYNSQSPFQRLSYPYIPSQELLVGGSFEFEAIYTFPPTATSAWKATYEAKVHYIHPTEGTQIIPLTLDNQPVDGHFSARHRILLDAKVGTEIYLELRVAVYNQTGKLMGEDTFPDPAGTLLKIGEITGDIRELLQFNEIY